MLQRSMADVLVVLHLCFIGFALLGGFSILWRRWMVLVHLPVLTWAALVEYNGWLCPLTPLENSFRRAAGGQGYSDGFVEHYLIPLIYPDELSRDIQIALLSILIGINLTTYFFVLYRCYWVHPDK